MLQLSCVATQDTATKSKGSRSSRREQIIEQIIERIVLFPEKGMPPDENSKERGVSWIVLDCWINSLSLQYFCISHAQIRSLVCSITQPSKICPSCLVIPVLLITQAISSSSISINSANAFKEQLQWSRYKLVAWDLFLPQRKQHHYCCNRLLRKHHHHHLHTMEKP